jgi:GAF domain-containing protein
MRNAASGYRWCRQRKGRSAAVTPLEPIPETVEAVDNLDPSADDGSLLADLTRLASQGQEIVPDLVGVSIAGFDHGLTFTLVATAGEVAVMDAVQYLGGGPCVEAAHTDQVMEFEPDALDEERWHLFAEATAARAVRSTLTLPVLGGGRVVGTVNLYAASRRAFVGHHEQLADVFGGWAAGAVANADLSFTTRKEAERAPQRLRNQNLIDVATRIVAAQLGVDVETAVARLRDAASRAGVSLLQLARDVVSARERQNREGE